MSGDPRVLAGLQQAYLASDAAMFASRRAMIRYAWRAETGTSIHDAHSTDAAIRSWTPPSDGSSVEQRVAELELKLSAVSATMQEHETDLENFGNQIHELFNRTDPEPTAPDDPVCAREGCGHTYSNHFHYNGDGVGCGWLSCPCLQFLPAPQPAPDLDPVRVEAAAKALRGAIGTPWDEIPAPSQAIYIHEAETVIRAYLKDGGA